MQHKQHSLWKTTAEKEAAKLLSSMNVTQLRQQVKKLEEKEREQRERLQQVYQSHLADLTKAFKTLVQQKENTKCITQSTKRLSSFCQKWNEEQQGTKRYALGTSTTTTTTVDKDEHLLRQYPIQESIISHLEHCKEDLSFIVESLEQADKDLDSGDYLACQLGLLTVRQRKEQLEQRLLLTTQPLKQFLASFWDYCESVSDRLEKKVSELLKTNAKLDIFSGFVFLLLLSHSNQSSLVEKWKLFLDLRYRCLSDCFSAISSDKTSSYNLELIEAGMNSIMTTLLIYEKLLQERKTPTVMETIQSLYNRQLDSMTLHFLHRQLEDINDPNMEIVCEDGMNKWLENVNQDMKCNLEEWLKQVTTEQNVDRLIEIFHLHISKLDSFSIEQNRRNFWEQIENLKRIWSMSLVTCIRHVFKTILNASFTNAEQFIKAHMEGIMRNNISTCLQTESYWKHCGDWAGTFWMYIDQERNDNRKIFTCSLLESDKCTWEVWIDEFLMKDMNIRIWYDPLIEHLKRLFHQTFPSLLSLLLHEERQSVLDRIHKQILQCYSQFLQSLEKQLDGIMSHICLLCQEKEMETSESLTKQDFVLSGLLYLYRCVRILRNLNLFPSSIEELGSEWIGKRNQLFTEMELKFRHHLIHHMIFLSILQSLKTQSLTYCSLENISTCSDSSEDSIELDSKYPSESLIQWFMELGKYTQLLDALHFTEDIQIFRLFTCSHFMKWLECFGVMKNLKDGKLTNLSITLQLYMDLIWMGDICFSQHETSNTEQETNNDVYSKWKEYKTTLETLLNTQNLPSNWKEQLESNTCFHLDRMGHLLGRLSISSYSKQQTAQVKQATFKEAYSSPILPVVARFPYLPAPTPSLLHRHRNRRASENKLFESSETKTWKQVSSNVQNKQKKEYTNTSVVDFASQFVGQQMGRFGSKFLESLKTYGGTSSN
ncbi:hypothetical protein Gasu2_67500 [Galdieria sulphuraria]|nr:hypothetical protein Gasu2_67500 [Galdieria sulphuraria]